jgi:hypothetical protein
MIVIEMARRPTQSLEESETDSGVGLGVFCMLGESTDGLNCSEK